ncbi:flagellar hook-associated protein FlgL [Campylobacter jejuni]|uniref:flagellar hook-associated protein FlgL n=1 Tax=Campylobacter TaxID=194 RepID=UPI00015D00F4|nr:MULTISPECIES: flagellar hook-associated protein FlgL [Campylobacter]KQI59089.1 lagellar hook-associated protein FlgL [Campylobacter jejuni CVM 41905]ABV52423.1 putative flagellin [Campylobacter jejuni subsp. jejuni 81116]ADN91057.1 Flagellin family protein [Campylobacter jejuni subsp. jejuni M1]AII24597.1 flagellar hook-associated protein FlgL [Campylobacter jejuni subsp. jejuni]ALK81450.1 Flagellar hook-associated protein FlgL/FlaD [Campylobacter jejuni]
MRITNKLNFTNSVNNSMGGQSALYQISQQLASGLKIQNSYEDASTYIDNTRLEYEIKTLEQVKESTSRAQEMTQNSMKALQDMVKLLEDFKVKVTQAASDSNSQTSREAIAKELERIKESIVQLANTSVNGQYLFAGSQVANKPFDSNGNYYGDKNNINVVTGAGTESPYNIPGWDLFFKADGDYKKQISTNVSFTDNRWDLNKDPDKTKYLTGDSKWQQLIGQGYVKDNGLDPDKDFEYDDKLDFPPTTLYVQGTKPDGTSFKSAVLVKPEDTLEDVMENIGALYGNTPNNKVVEVSMNDSGQIQITDLKQGNNKLDFHAVAFTPQADDRAELTGIIDAAKQEGISMDEVTNRVMQAATAAPSNGDITKLNSPVTVTINNQQFTIDLKQTDFIKSKMTDTDGNATNGADYDNVYFEKNGNTVYGNVSQVIKGSNAYATDSTKLSEVMAGDSLNGTTLNLKVNSKGGNSYDVTINLQTSTVSYPDPNNPGQTISFPITHTDPATGNSGVVTGSNDITYGQINDIIGMFAADKIPTQSITATNGKVDANGYNNLQQLMKDSQATVDVSMDYKGRISVTDKLSSGTNIEISLSDSQSGHFPQPPFSTTSSVTNGPNFSFSANNSLVIDEPNVDIIKDLDSMIDAVLKGNMRADSESEDPRNTGMQGALERLDHLADHISKLNTTMGAYHNTIEDVNTRSTFLSVNVQSIKSNVIDVDYGEAMMNLMQVQLAYQASLKASTTISQLSLLNYM